ncbi:hypothetical protein OCK74_19455 [Chitinophagaceae bacterium LB-8]|uniref:Pectate lyase superfamily protein domain-containing protein n=1 Tax=Paraflavisolibacter caeni TaxID=2982496 RepID=A0A9X2XPH0_9BACT|nr:hypothetical protein [Paraflavisolibacter caeni]MCU7551308.1 hypothetical protein [Paraflavisolibacter caeni]
MKTLFTFLLTMMILLSYAQKNAQTETAYEKLEKRIIALEKMAATKTSFGINIQDQGVLPSNTGEQNSLAIEKLINSLPAGKNTSLIFIPEGEYQFSKTIKIFNKSIRLEGVNNVTLIFKNGVSAIEINRNSSTPKCVIKDINFETRGAKTNPEAHGIIAHSITYLEGLKIKNFAGDGVRFTADMATNKTDVSHSKIEDVEVIQCGRHGFYFQGGDANQITVFHCGARDNGGVGFMDESFLGNQFISCMAHNNAGGHYKVMNANARGNVAFCYGEGGSPESEIRGVSNLWGGIHENGIKVSEHANSFIGWMQQKVISNSYSINENQLTFGQVNLRGNQDGNYSFNFRNDGKNANFFQFLTPPAVLKDWDNAERKVPFASIAVRQYFVGNRIVLYARSVDDLKKWGHFNNFNFINGDRIYNSEYKDGAPEKWVCIQGGILDKAKWKAFY